MHRVLTIVVFCAVCVCSFSGYADTPPSVPVISVEVESLDVPNERKPDVITEPVQDAVPTKKMKSITFDNTKPKETKEPAVLDGKVEQGDDHILPDFFSGVAKTSTGLTVIELFSTQACTFCPKADALMAEFIDHDFVIALSCHVDYFDVRIGSRALPFCSSRQIAYEKGLGKSTKYTPQIIVNGRYDAIGYKPDAVLSALETAIADRIISLHIEYADSVFTLSLPDLFNETSATVQYDIWLMVFDLPQVISVADGGNAGKTFKYYNLVSNVGFLGKWDGRAKEIKFDPKMTDQSKGFAIIVQNHQSKQIVAAVKHIK